MSPRFYPTDVTIFDTKTGERVVWRDDHGMDDPYNPGQFSDYIWRDGNFSCDCNRGLFFTGAKGLDEYEEEDVKCGDERYIVEKIVRLSDGATVYADDHYVRSAVPEGKDG